MTERLWTEYEAFAARDLSKVHPLLLLGRRGRATSARYCPEGGAPAWAITWEGKKVLIHLGPGTKESTEVAGSSLKEMRRRGLADPVLVCTAGALASSGPSRSVSRFSR